VEHAERNIQRGPTHTSAFVGGGLNLQWALAFAARQDFHCRRSADETPYSGGHFKLEVTVPEQYRLPRKTKEAERPR